MIDAHVHVLAKASAEFPRMVTKTTPAEFEAPVERLLENMESTGVERANLIQSGGHEIEHHRYLQHCLKTYPDRFRGIGRIANTLRPEKQMDCLAETGGIIGFRMTDIGGPLDPLAPMDVRSFSSYPVWKHAAEKDYVIWLYPKAAQNHCVPFLMEAFPELTVVYNHMAFCPGDTEAELPIPPQTRYNTMGLYQYPNVCVALSGQYAFSRQAYPYADLGPWHNNLLRTFKADHLLWGTDSPWILQEPGYDRSALVIDELMPDLSPADRALIMGGTAAMRLFNH
jgi:L-fuconolactonase